MHVSIHSVWIPQKINPKSEMTHCTMKLICKCISNLYTKLPTFHDCNSLSYMAVCGRLGFSRNSESWGVVINKPKVMSYSFLFSFLSLLFSVIVFQFRCLLTPYSSSDIPVGSRGSLASSRGGAAVLGRA